MASKDSVPVCVSPPPVPWKTADGFGGSAFPLQHFEKLRRKAELAKIQRAERGIVERKLQNCAWADKIQIGRPSESICPLPVVSKPRILPFGAR